MKTICRIVAILMVVCLLSSCWWENHIIYKGYQATPVEGWEAQNVLNFTIDSVRWAGRYSVVLGLRTTNAYPFQSLWLTVRQQWHNPDTTFVDTLKCTIVDEMGNQRGRGISVKQNKYKVCELPLMQGQEGILTVTHIMRRSILEGVSDVGISIEQKFPK